MRSTFGSSRLVRLLGGGTPLAAEAPGGDFAERLSLWLNAFDAIRLQSAHQAIRAIRAPAAASGSGRAAARPDLAGDLQRVRSTLAKAIARDPLAGAADETGYAPWRERHLELQRQMELMIRPLRDHARQVLACRSPRLRQLAALDAVLDETLAPREQALLPTVVALLERRHEQLAPGPRDAFADDWRQALLAELELRLEPVAGLVEALAQEPGDSP